MARFMVSHRPPSPGTWAPRGRNGQCTSPTSTCVLAWGQLLVPCRSDEQDKCRGLRTQAETTQRTAAEPPLDKQTGQSRRDPPGRSAGCSETDARRAGSGRSAGASGGPASQPPDVSPGRDLEKVTAAGAAHRPHASLRVCTGAPAGHRPAERLGSGDPRDPLAEGPAVVGPSPGAPARPSSDAPQFLTQLVWPFILISN